MSIRTKLLILFTALYALLFLVGGFLVQRFAVGVAENEIKTTLLAAATGTASKLSAADSLEVSSLDTSAITFDPKTPYWGITDPAYQRMVDTLALSKKLGGQVADPTGLLTSRLSIYTYIATNDPKVIRYIGSASAANNPPGGVKLGTLYTTKPNGATNYIVTGLTEPIVNLETPVADQWGVWYSAFAPIQDANGTVVGAVGVDMHDTTVAATRDAITKALVAAFFIAFIVLFILVVIASRLLTAPLLALASAASRVAEGHYDAKLPSQGRFPDETAQLARAFETMMGKVRQREETLKQEVSQLRVEVDEARRTKQVSEIVETEFFKDLQLKAQSMRNRRHAGPSSSAAAPAGSTPAATAPITAAPVTTTPAPKTAEAPTTTPVTTAKSGASGTPGS